MKQKIDSDTYPTWLKKAATCRDLVFQAVDLRQDDVKLSQLPQATSAADACVFLGCKLGPLFAEAAAKNFALIFPDLPGRTYHPFRGDLYSIDELLGGFDPSIPTTYRSTPDWLTYISYIKVDAQNQPLKPVQYVVAGADEILARRLHDHFISTELNELLNAFDPARGGKGVVAFMGGHDRKRSDSVFTQVARLARKLTLDGYLVVSGGGPGLMEAANMGAFFAERTEAVLDSAINEIAVPKISDSYGDPDWLKAAWNVRLKNLPTDFSKSRSVGIPTWFYGHEPPNVFASQIAKYFENSLREEGLLAIATHGVIFAEGNAGTVQEIFQDGCQNYYDNYGYKSPMILFGRATWDPAPSEMSDDKTSPLYGNKPAWPLLAKLARMKGFEKLVTLTDDPEVVLKAVRDFKAPGQP